MRFEAPTGVKCPKGCLDVIEFNGKYLAVTQDDAYILMTDLAENLFWKPVLDPKAILRELIRSERPASDKHM